MKLIDKVRSLKLYNETVELKNILKAFAKRDEEIQKELDSLKSPIAQAMNEINELQVRITQQGIKITDLEEDIRVLKEKIKSQATDDAPVEKIPPAKKPRRKTGK